MPKSKWAESRRGFRHQVIEAMMAKGLSYRESDKVMGIVIDEMKISLARGEKVCFDWGALLKVRRPDPKRVWRFGRVVTLYQPPYKVVLLPE